MQTLQRQLGSLSSSLHKAIVGHHLLPARSALQSLSLIFTINFLHPSRCFGVQSRGHNLSSRYKTLESNIRPDHVRKQVEEEIDRPLVTEEEPVSSEHAQEPFFDTGVSALQMERIKIKGKSVLRPKPIMFHGISILPKPLPPASDGMLSYAHSFLATLSHELAD